MTTNKVYGKVCFELVIFACFTNTLGRSINDDSFEVLFRRQVGSVIEDFNRRLIYEAQRFGRPSTAFESREFHQHNDGCKEHQQYRREMTPSDESYSVEYGYQYRDSSHDRLEKIPQNPNHGRSEENLQNHFKAIPESSRVSPGNAENIPTGTVFNGRSINKPHYSDGEAHHSSKDTGYLKPNSRKESSNRKTENRRLERPFQENNSERDSRSNSNSQQNDFDDENYKVSYELKPEYEREQNNKNNANVNRPRTQSLPESMLRTNKPSTSNGNQRTRDGSYTIWPSDDSTSKIPRPYDASDAHNIGANPRDNTATNKGNAATTARTNEFTTAKANATTGETKTLEDDLEDRIALDAPCPGGTKRVNGTCLTEH